MFYYIFRKFKKLLPLATTNHVRPLAAQDLQLALWASQISCAGPLGQLDIYCWPKGQQGFEDSKINPQLRGYGKASEDGNTNHGNNHILFTHYLTIFAAQKREKILSLIFGSVYNNIKFEMSNIYNIPQYISNPFATPRALTSLRVSYLYQ